MGGAGDVCPEAALWLCRPGCEACTAAEAVGDAAALWVGPADDGEAVGEAEVLGDPDGDGDGLGEVLGVPEPPLGLGLGEPDALDDDDCEGFGEVAEQVGEEPDELISGPGPPPYVVVPPPGLDEEEPAPPLVPEPPPGLKWREFPC